MPKSDTDELLQRLLAIFRVEAAEHLKAMSALVLALEKPAPLAQQPGLIEALFREAHSLKGAARSVNLSAVEDVCKRLETLLAPLKERAPEPLAPAWFETVYPAVDSLERLLAPGDEGGAPERPSAAAPATPPAAPPVAAAGGDTVRIATAKLAALQVQSEELLAFKFGAGHLVGELRALAADMARWTRDKRRGAPGDPDVKAFGERLAAVGRTADQERRALAGAIDALQGDIRQALLLPFAGLFELLPKLVRDLARDGGKEAEVSVAGAGIEIDRRILEQMKDPLIHLVRNAVDHGIEPAPARRLAGKPAPGRIAVTVTPLEGNRVELVVADDGAGADLEKIRAAAVKRGLVAAEAAPALADDAVRALMFESGLSTSAILTDISGRGLGLAIVREKVEKLGGSVAVEAPSAGGTRFRIVLPTTLATFRGLLVAVGERQFVLPAQSVECVLRAPAGDVKTVENRETVEVGDRVVALVRLADALGLPAAANGERLQLAVVEGGGRRIAFAVDAILGDQAVLVKSLGPQLRRVSNVGGATVIGPGRVVPILNVADLMKSAQRARPRAAAPVAPPPVRQLSLLVVEDSVTARTLLRNILESAGYAVATAVDGVDALTALKSGEFDLVVSDVEMPRMDGFDLTARIRADKKLVDLPVVLVTALESREHKERGIEVGANAYIVKSSFDQGNLLEAIRRLG